MIIVCPSCGATHSLDAIISHEAARSALVRAMEMTPLGRRLIKYLGLWRTGKRPLSWDKVRELLDELNDLVEIGRIERNHRSWAAPTEYWIAGIDEMLARRDAGTLRTPLKSHGYLFEILAGMSNKGEAQAEARIEQQRQGAAGTGSGDRQEKRTGMPISIKEQLKNFTTKGAM